MYMYLTWHSNPQYGGAPSAFCEVGVQEDFQCNLLSCSWMWLTSFMGHPLFALGLSCVWFLMFSGL